MSTIEFAVGEHCAFGFFYKFLLLSRWDAHAEEKGRKVRTYATYADSHFRYYSKGMAASKHQCMSVSDIRRRKQPLATGIQMLNQKTNSSFGSGKEVDERKIDSIHSKMDKRERVIVATVLGH